ncbi:hypothetical protein NL676_039089 [Syzygium grande]|nr:hypothetical protein NL676_039089 [Syzygium grande]
MESSGCFFCAKCSKTVAAFRDLGNGAVIGSHRGGAPKARTDPGNPRALTSRAGLLFRASGLSSGFESLGSPPKSP